MWQSLWYDIFKITPLPSGLRRITERVTNQNNQWFPPSLRKEWQIHVLKRFSRVKGSFIWYDFIVTSLGGNDWNDIDCIQTRNGGWSLDKSDFLLKNPFIYSIQKNDLNSFLTPFLLTNLSFFKWIRKNEFEPNPFHLVVRYHSFCSSFFYIVPYWK